MTEREAGLMASVARVDGEGPAWLASIRREAAARLREGGFPGKKHEKWRFTSVREVVDTAFDTAFETASPDRGEALARWVDERLGGGAGVRVVLAGGRLVSAAGELHGVHVESLRAALERAPAELEPVLGALAPREHFAALNAALFEDGVLLRVTGAVERPIEIVHVARAGAATRGGAPTAAYPRVVVIAEPESRATLIETYLSEGGDLKHLTSAVTEITIGEAARLEHARVVLGEERAFHLAYLAVRQERGSFYASRVVTLGGALSRLDLDVRLIGESAEAILEGVYHVDGTEHVDHQLSVEHAAPHTTSATRYRGLLDGKGHAVLNAMGIVRPSAPGTALTQENRNLLLSDDATIDTKPHLEIETDEVKASHGATIGAVDDAALFYLRSRGIPEAEARDLLTFAFIRELLEHIPDEATARRASEAVLSRLPSGARMRDEVAT